MAGGIQTTMDLVLADEFNFIELIQRSLNGLNLQHAIGKYFTLQFA